MLLPPEALQLPLPLVASARLLPDRSSMLALLPKRRIFVEVGVGLGTLSHFAMEICQPSTFIGIDNFLLHEIPMLWGQPSKVLLNGLTHEAAYRAQFAREAAAGTFIVLTGESAECLERLDDRSVDIIYIDADHRYGPVRDDLAVARCKIKDDGWIILNDYVMIATLDDTEPYGVINAANEFMIEHDWGIQYLALQPQMFRDIALRPRRFLNPNPALDGELARLQVEVRDLRASTSWQVTAPLLGLGAMIQRYRSARKAN